MPCNPDELRHVPLFELLDDDEAQILAAKIEVRKFAPRQRIYKSGEMANHAYVVMTGKVRLTSTDDDHQEVLIDEPEHGDFFGFASMLQETEHHTTAMATEETVCLEVGRDDIESLLCKKPMAGMDMLKVQARQFHAAQKLIRTRTARNANEVIEEQLTFGERIADVVASFGGSWAMLAAIQAPVIMMSQNRQDTKDRVRSELDFQVNVRAESEIQSLSNRMSLLMDKLDDVAAQIPDRETGNGTGRSSPTPSNS